MDKILRAKKIAKCKQFIKFLKEEINEPGMKPDQIKTLTDSLVMEEMELRDLTGSPTTAIVLRADNFNLLF